MLRGAASRVGPLAFRLREGGSIIFRRIPLTTGVSKRYYTGLDSETGIRVAHDFQTNNVQMFMKLKLILKQFVKCFPAYLCLSHNKQTTSLAHV